MNGVVKTTNLSLARVWWCTSKSTVFVHTSPSFVLSQQNCTKTCYHAKHCHFLTGSIRVALTPEHTMPFSTMTAMASFNFTNLVTDVMPKMFTHNRAKLLSSLRMKSSPPACCFLCGRALPAALSWTTVAKQYQGLQLPYLVVSRFCT